MISNRKAKTKYQRFYPIYRNCKIDNIYEIPEFLKM